MLWLKARIPAEIRISSWGDNFTRTDSLEKLDLFGGGCAQGKGTHGFGRFVIESLKKIGQLKSILYMLVFTKCFKFILDRKETNISNITLPFVFFI